MAIVLGLNAVTTRGDADDIDTLNWVEVLNIRDETLNMDTSLADITTRKAAGWRLQVGTLSEGSVDCQIMYDTADADFVAFEEAFFNKTRINMGFWDGPQATIGTQGLQGGWSVTNFTINRQLEEAMMVDVTFTVRDDSNGNGPTWETTSA